MLGKTLRLDGSLPAFSNAEIDFWQEHVFDPGTGGETEVLWVTYRNRQRAVTSLGIHRLTQQAIVPLTGEITLVVAGSVEDGPLERKGSHERAVLMHVGLREGLEGKEVGFRAYSTF